MSFDLLSKQGRDARPDLLQRQDFVGGLEFRGRLGHPKDCAGGAILRNRMVALFTQSAQAFGAISPHASQYDPDNVAAPKACNTLEKDIHGWTVRGFQRISSV